MRPANSFVAGFIGSPAMNQLAGTVSGDTATVGSYQLALSPAQQQAMTSNKITIGARPEALAFVGADDNGLTAHIDVVEELGSESFLYCTAEGENAESITMREDGLSDHRAGQTIRVAPQGDLHLFDTATGERLPD